MSDGKFSKSRAARGASAPSPPPGDSGLLRVSASCCLFSGLVRILARLVEVPTVVGAGGTKAQHSFPPAL